jgi:hypothetical protein
VKDNNYVIPTEFPSVLDDVKHVLDSSPIYQWLAEFNSHCIKRLIKEQIGAPDAALMYLANNYDQQSQFLKLDHTWKGPAKYLLQG